MPVIELTTEIHAPIERSFDLARSVEVHMDSTAETNERAVAGVLSGLMALGDEVTWRARHFGVWQHLTSRITMFERPFHFRDSMVRGAFRRFDHDHFFAQQGENTVMRDVFDFQSPFGIFGRTADRLFLTDYMRSFLLTRCTWIKTIAETEHWRRYISG